MILADEAGFGKKLKWNDLGKIEINLNGIAVRSY